MGRLGSGDDLEDWEDQEEEMTMRFIDLWKKRPVPERSRMVEGPTARIWQSDIYPSNKRSGPTKISLFVGKKN